MRQRKLELFWRLLNQAGSADNLEKMLRWTIQREGPVRQKPIFCPDCKREIDILDPDVRVSARDLDFGDYAYTVLDPYCPRCGRLVKARHYIVH